MNAERQEADRLLRATDAFLADHTIDQPFYARDLAAELGLDEGNAAQLLHDLERRGEVHQSQGGWQPGPEPPPSQVDQL